MDDKYIAILGGLVGSSFTIVVNKIFEYFQSRQLHKLELKKEFFLRRLNVYEKSVSLWTVVHTSISNMAVLAKTAMNENVTFSDEQSQDIFMRLENNIKQVYEVTQETAYSIGLYIDLKHDDKEVEDTQRFWELLGTINQLVHNINYYYDLQKNATTKERYEQLESLIDSNTLELEMNVESLLALSNFMRKRFLGLTSILREQLKAYE